MKRMFRYALVGLVIVSLLLLVNCAPQPEPEDTLLPPGVTGIMTTCNSANSTVVDGHHFNVSEPGQGVMKFLGMVWGGAISETEWAVTLTAEDFAELDGLPLPDEDFQFDILMEDDALPHGVLNATGYFVWDSVNPNLAIMGFTDVVSGNSSAIFLCGIKEGAWFVALIAVAVAIVVVGSTAVYAYNAIKCTPSSGTIGLDIKNVVKLGVSYELHKKK